MKGKDLIACIQKYGLEEHDFPICSDKDGVFVGYISIEEACKKYRVPISVIRQKLRNHEIDTIRVLNKDLLSSEQADIVLKDYKSNTEKWKERKRNEL